MICLNHKHFFFLNKNRSTWEYNFGFYPKNTTVIKKKSSTHQNYLFTSIDMSSCFCIQYCHISIIMPVSHIINKFNSKSIDRFRALTFKPKMKKKTTLWIWPRTKPKPFSSKKWRRNNWPKTVYRWMACGMKFDFVDLLIGIFFTYSFVSKC